MSNINFDENSLIKGCLSNDARCQKELYEKYKSAMFVHCLRYASDRAEAEDMLQEGFLIVFKELHQYEGSRGALGGWIRRVVINSALQVIRKKKISFSEMDASYEEVSNDEDAVSQLSLKELLVHIQSLPNGYRTVFNMYAIDGMQHNEIAELLQISINTSKTQLFKAKQMLQKMIISSAFVVA
jgi:RNA polymerase sigma factor (sigma-70 family)